MRYRVEHTTAFTYAKPVELASHMVHLLPRALPHQQVIDSELIADPVAGRRSDALDHYGNRVSWLFLDMQWQAAEFVFHSSMAAADPAVAAYVARSFPAGRKVLIGVLDLLERIRSDFRFQGGVTTIATPVGKVLAQKAGVCQDFSHLMISGLRSLGIPARYVSGYIRTKPPPGQERRRGADQSHAWVGVWLGPDHGWVDVDPTNNLIVRDEHVVLGWGRDYGDLSPVRGVILGGGKHTVKVGVDLLEV
jgi:transglutaminase-like putative cysteine protease